MNLNFTGVEDAAPDAVRAAYTAADHDRLTRLKAVYYPDNAVDRKRAVGTTAADAGHEA